MICLELKAELKAVLRKYYLRVGTAFNITNGNQSIVFSSQLQSPTVRGSDFSQISENSQGND